MYNYTREMNRKLVDKEYVLHAYVFDFRRMSTAFSGEMLRA